MQLRDRAYAHTRQSAALAATSWRAAYQCVVTRPIQGWRGLRASAIATARTACPDPADYVVPTALRPREAVLTPLTGAGFSGPDALHIYRAPPGSVPGHVLNELQESVGNRRDQAFTDRSLVQRSLSWRPGVSGLTNRSFSWMAATFAAAALCLFPTRESA